MQTYTESEQQNLSVLLEQAARDDEVRIQRADGTMFVLRPEKTESSALDIAGMDLKLTTQEIVEFVREGREQSKSLPLWAKGTDRPSEHLEKMLSLAVTNFGKQTDWFLLHRDTGIKHLGAVLAAQVSLTSITLSTHAVPAWLAIGTLLLLGVIGPFLAILAIRSTRSSYRASIEYAVLITKSLWALGLTGVVDVPKSIVEMNKSPVASDETFYIARHVKSHTLSGRTTEEIVNKVLTDGYNTFYWARGVLVTFAAAVDVMAILGAIAVVVKK